MKHIRTSFIMLIVFTVITGGMYPLLMTGIGAVFFPKKVQGSLVVPDGEVKGSVLIGQDFSRPEYFHPRPSAVGYDSSTSGGSNLGYTSRDLKQAVMQRMEDWRNANGGTDAPQEMLSASGSGLDPDISPESAELQAPRVAAARYISAEDAGKVLALVRRFEQGPTLGFLGEPRVNVFELNLALDREFPPR